MTLSEKDFFIEEFIWGIYVAFLKFASYFLRYKSVWNSRKPDKIFAFNTLQSKQSRENAYIKLWQT